jgi:hypothetical protein
MVKRKIGGAGLLSAAFVLVLTLMVAGTASARFGEGLAKADSKSARANYIVRMVQAPVVAYTGGVAGLKATKPAKGQKINPQDGDVVKYVAYLDERHAEAVGKVGGQKYYDYRYTFNGFAARLNPGQVAKLQADPNVLTVEKDELGHVDTATTPAFMGLTQTGGAWDQLGGVGKAGENIIIGVVDTGIVRDSHGSFTDRDRFGKRVYQRMPGWHGRCVPGEGWTAEDCGDKLIGAQFFNAGFGADRIADRDFLSPRDYNGHGSHTASTAGGNNGVPATGAAALFGNVSGMAPRARIAMYKVCWEDEGDGGCANSDSVMAIDQAVADGVDVINFSISGTRTNYLDAVEVAYLFAADAGVFVATSAGNNGPPATTVAHISPWLAATAAGTHNRSGTAKAILGNGAEYTGASLTNAVGPAPLVHSSSVGKAGANAVEVALCFLGTLDPAKATGKIVLCDRGVNARVDKSAAVKEAGGVGMILRNLTPSSLNADLHTVPTVHVDEVAGAAIKAYIDANPTTATARLTQSVVNTSAPAPDVAAFSSRGPSLAGGGDIMKPDFMAPGVDILAAVAPEGNNGRSFDLLSGTSMSSPHVAGFGALLSQKHPNWSPAAQRSALATTADATSRAGLNLPFNVGSGHVRPTLALDPGLVYDAGFNDYLSFLKGQRLCCSTLSIPAIDASDLNQPSLAVGDLAGTQTLTRKVTNVGGSSANYTANISAPAGFTVNVNPSSFTIPANGTQQFTVTITRTDAPLSTSPTTGYRFGSLTWSDGTHNVRSPIVVRPVAIAAPAELNLTGASGSTSYSIKTGYAGTLSYAKRGMIPATTTNATVTDDPTNNFNTANPAGNQGITVHDLVVPAGSVYTRISLFDANTDGEDDLDVYVYNAGGTLVGASGGGTSAEEVNLVNPAAGTYKVYVHGWQTDGPDANYTLFTWVLGTTDAGNMTVTGPGTATIGGTGTVNLSWSGATPAGTKYLGQIAYQEGATTHGTTIVRVDG